MQHQSIPFHAPLYQVVPRVGTPAAVSGARVPTTAPAPAPVALASTTTAAASPAPATAVHPSASKGAGGTLPTAEQLLESIAELLVELKKHRQQSLGELQQLAVELAVAVAAKLTYEKLQEDQFAMERLVMELLAEFAPGEPLRVRMNPADVAMLKKRIVGLRAPWAGQLEVEFEEDENLPRGSCQANSESYGLVTDLATRVEILRHRLLDGIEHAQIERRKTAAGNSGLQRFPDRRETA